MIEYAQEAVNDLIAIRTGDGMEQMLMLFEWCERLPEPSTRIEAERLGGPDGLFRLRVGNYHILFQLQESRGRDSIRVLRIRARKPPA